MYNRAIIIGRLTKEPELKQTTGGKSVCSFTVAVNRRYSREETDFLDCVAWQRTAEFLCRYFHKGGAIGVEGAIQTRKYEDRNGNQRTTVEIVADNVSFVGGKENGGPVEISENAEHFHSPANRTFRFQQGKGGAVDVEYGAPTGNFEEFDGADDLPF